MLLSSFFFFDADDWKPTRRKPSVNLYTCNTLIRYSGNTASHQEHSHSKGSRDEDRLCLGRQDGNGHSIQRGSIELDRIISGQAGIRKNFFFIERPYSSFL